MTTPDDEACSIDLEIEVPGTPEQVWEAIATGPGISAWMHPTEVEEREGGSFSFDMGSGMTGAGVVAGWDPPHRFVEETEWRPQADAPPARLATEWLVVTTGLGAHGEEALRVEPPQPGQRVLDIGCGFGDTTQRIAALVGAEGVAVGVDAAPRFIETAIAEAEEAGVANARFLVADVQASPIEGPFDRAFSRMGTMFFANPVAALRNVRRSLGPGGRLAMVVWRRREDNDWLYRGADDRRGHRQPSRGVRRAHLRPGPVLDGGRRHHQ